MVQLVTPGLVGGASLTPNILGGVQAGQQISRQQQILQAQEQAQQAAQQQAAAEAEQRQRAGALLERGMSGEQIQTGPQLAKLFLDNPELGQQVLDSMNISSEFQKNDLAEFGFFLENTPPEQRQQLIDERVERIVARGGDPSQTLALKDIDPQRQNQMARMFQIQALNVKEQQDLANKARGFELDERKLAQEATLTREGIASRERIAGAQLAAKDTRTSAAKNAIEVGLTRGSPEYKQFIKDQVLKSRTTVNVGAGEPAFLKALGKKQADQFSKVLDEGDAGSATLDSVARMEAIGADSGRFAETKLEIAKVARAFGLDSLATEIADIPTSEALRAESQRAVQAILMAATGVQTDGDADRARQTVASLGNDPRSNQFINDTLKATALRQVERKDFFERALEEGQSFNEMSRAWSKRIENFPNISNKLKNKNGLPVFFHEFKANARSKNPNISDIQIENAWRTFHGE